MATPIPGVRGIAALQTADAQQVRQLEQVLIACAEACGYGEIVLPMLERTELFTRSIGEGTDIVGKEMYSFLARDDESLSLRPEGTAGCVRMAVEQGWGVRRPARFWYAGPMFRYERPQKGRARQFRQFGVEALGMAGVEVEVELLLLCARIWKQLGVAKDMVLEISSLGDSTCRARYRDDLVTFLRGHQSELDEHSQARLETNPLRILDSKDEGTGEILQQAPSLLDYLDDEARSNLDTVLALLDGHGLEYRLNPRLVRGLDYYNHTVFEWLTCTGLGAQNAVCAGGRYDGLCERLGGESVPAAGFALGLERLLLLQAAASDGQQKASATAKLYIAVPTSAARARALLLAEQLRDLTTHVGVITCLGDASLKSQMKQAHAEEAGYVVLAGERELAAGQVRVRRMKDGEEELFSVTEPEALLQWTGNLEKS